MRTYTNHQKVTALKNFLSFFFYGGTLCTLVIAAAANAKWDDLNPGAGGQVQDIVPDPQVDGRLFLVSDMEGIYRSDNQGEDWYYTSDDLEHHRAYTVAPDPSDSERVYTGTLYGVHVSDNGGINHRLAKATANTSIGIITVNPNDSDHIVAGQGWRDDGNYSGGIGNHNKNGLVTIFQSYDRGQTWQKKTLPSNRNANPNIFSIAFHPNNQNRFFVASAQGLYESKNKGREFSKVSTPSGFKDFTLHACTGVALSPNGGHLYATYQKGKDVNKSPAVLFGTSTNQYSWKRLSNQKGIESILLWQPEVNPRSANSEHELLLPTLRDRSGLWKARVKWDQQTLKNVSFEKIWSGTAGYDPGWENTSPGPRVARFTPTSWRQEAVWSTINQSMHRGTVGKNGSYNWENKYSRKEDRYDFDGWGKNHREQFTYSSRGTVSTYTFDVAAHKNYVIQGQADNGFMESWDYGKSWTNIPGRALKVYDARAVAIAKMGGKRVVLAQGANAYGGNAGEGRLYLKELNSYSPKDRWRLIGAGSQRLGGLPNAVIQEIAVDPKNNNRVFIGYDAQGLWLINDLKNFSEGKSRASKVSGSSFNAVREVAFHPKNSSVYVSAYDKRGLFKGVYNAASNRYDWTKIASGSGAGAQVKAWSWNNKNYLLYSAKWQGGIDGASSDHHSLGISLDDGKTWKAVLTPEIAKRKRSNSWFKNINSRYSFNISGVAVSGNTIVASYYDHAWSKGYGTFKGILNKDSSVDWQDWTANFHFKGGTDAEVFSINGDAYYYTGTQGVGMWRRKLSEGAGYSPSPAKPVEPTVPDENIGIDTLSRFAMSANVELKGAYRLKDNWFGYYPTPQAINNFSTIGVAEFAASQTQQWIFEKAGKNTYRIKNRSTGLYLNPFSDREGANINMVRYNESWDSLKWIAERTYNGEIRLRNEWNGLYLTSANEPGKILIQNKLHRSWTAQRWTLLETNQLRDQTELKQSDKTVRLRSMIGSEVMTASTKDRYASAALEPLEPNYSSQKFVLEHFEGDMYRLKNVWSGGYLNTYAEPEGSAMNIVPFNASWDSLLWKLERIDANRYRIKNFWSGQYLSVQNREGELASSRLRMGWNGQIWKFE